MEGLLLNRSRMPEVSSPYMPKVRLLKLPRATCLIASFMSKSPGTVPPGHMVVPLPSDLRVLLVIGSPRESTDGWLFQSVEELIGPVHLTKMVSEPSLHEFKDDHTSLIFSVELTMTMLGLRALVST